MKVNKTFRLRGEGAETRIEEEFSKSAPQIANARPTVFPRPRDAVTKTVSVLGLFLEYKKV